MELVVAGLLNKQIARELGISEITVKAHRGKVMHKMQAGSLADLVRMAGRLGAEMAEMRGGRTTGRRPGRCASSASRQASSRSARDQHS
jgi:hypothetical protein